MLRGPLVQRGAGAVWTRFQGVCTCWLTSNQGGVRLVLMAATPLHFPGQNAQQERLQWCGTKSQGMNPGMELGLTVQKQPWRPGVWSWPQLRARYQHPPSRAGSGHSGLYQCADQWHQGDARVGWTLLGGGHRGAFPCRNTHPPQTTAWSWNVVNKTWERPPTGTTQVPGCSTAPVIHVAAVTLPPAHPTPQPCTRSGMNTSEKGTCPWAVIGQNCGSWHRWHIGWPHRPHLFQQSPPLGQGMPSRAIEPYWTQPSGLLLKTLGE